MSGLKSNDASGDSMGRFDAVLAAYKSRTGGNAEPSSELDARILALAALPARVHLSTEAPTNIATRNRPRGALRWLSWAAGAGALLLSGGVLRVMLQDSPNATRVQESAKASEARQVDSANVLPDAAEPISGPISRPIDAAESLSTIELDQRAATSRRDILEAPTSTAPAEIAAESIAESAPASSAVLVPKASVPEKRSILAPEPVLEPVLEPVEPVGRSALAMPNSRAASPSGDGIVAAVPVPQAFSERSQPASEVTQDAQEPSAQFKEFETKSDEKPYAAKLAQPIEESFAASETGIAADKAAAMSELDEELLDSVAVTGSRIRSSKLETSAPAVAIPEAIQTLKKAPTADEPIVDELVIDEPVADDLRRAFAQLRKLQRAGDLKALKREIEKFRADFPADTKIPEDLRAVFKANPARVK